MAGGSSFAGESDDAVIADVNVTPLVDVVLVLLIVMMITMPTIVSVDLMNERELDVALPEAGAAKPLISKPQELVVNVDRDGRYTVHQNRQSTDDLLRLMEQEYANNPGKATVIIRADKFCNWQSVVTVMNLCNRAHIRDYRATTAE